MNVRTRTFTLSVHFPQYCELKTWTFSFWGSHKNFLIITFEGMYLNFEQRYKDACLFRYKTCVFSRNNLFTLLSTQHILTQNSKLRTSMCQSNAAFIVQISIQSKAQHIIIRQDVPLQRQFYWTATDMWTQFSHETVLVRKLKCNPTKSKQK